MTTLATIAPGGIAPVTPDALERLRSSWLDSLGSPNTRNAYRRDLECFTRWCADQGGSPVHANRAGIDRYRAELEDRGLRPATVARRLAALASFYRYAYDAELIDRMPTERVRRPRVSTESPRLGLDSREAVAFLAAGDRAGGRDRALVTVLVLNGLRVSEAIALDADALATERGHRVARIVGKGGKERTAALDQRTADAIDAVLAGRTTGPVFTGADGARLNRHQAARIVARIARAAGITKRISPHSLRHTMVTLMLEEGQPLHRVQDAAGHADPATTRRYDRARHQLDQHPTYALAAFLAAAAA